MPKVTMIPATKNITSLTPKSRKSKRRVAAYARVSTDSEEQLTSYEAQVDYYTRYIQNREDWEFIDIYTDEGISATNTKHRDGFNRMIADALSGMIDLIITKSVSRFARNTVDSLTTVRKLKEKGVEVYFQKENIFTLDSKGELLITIMSSLAQEESRSISENVTWGQRKRFADGKIMLPYHSFLGYRKGKDGLPEIVPEEAEIIKEIYKLFMHGQTTSEIAKHLMKKGTPTPAGKKKWYPSTVNSILTNEKYKGSALLQKTFTVDFLTKKKKINEGEVPQYYVENSHPAIIPPEEFDLVQAEIIRRKEIGRSYSGNSPFASKIICSDCGSYFGSKVWHSNTKYRRTIWQCNHKFKNGCETPHLYEDKIKEKFLAACQKVLADKEEFINSCKLIRDILAGTSDIDEKIKTTEENYRETETIILSLIRENSEKAQDQSEFERIIRPLELKLEELVKRLDTLKDKKEKRLARQKALDAVIETADFPLDSFDGASFKSLIEKVTVQRNGKLIFRFLNEFEVEI